MPETFRLQWPVDNPVVTQHFGKNPDFYKPFGLPGHEGLDLYAPMNANIYAAADGQVYQVGHPPDHPYGLHIRIKHVVGDKVYRTIYAHLAQAEVSVDQHVTAGQRIGLADNTGNSFGSHLHLTLKVDGAQTPGYPPRIVDPWPYLQEIQVEHPSTSDLIVYPVTLLSLRSNPSMRSDRLAILAEGEPLTVLGDSATARSQVGKQGEWIQTKRQDGQSGYVAAWYLRVTGETAPDSSLVVYPTHLLSLRARPSSDSNRLATLAPEDALQVLGDAISSRAKIGQYGQWLNVRAPSDHTGHVAAWFVREEKATPPTRPTPGEFLTLTAYPSVNLTMRAIPSLDASKVGTALYNRPVSVMSENPAADRAKIGQEGQWLYIETEDNVRGWAAAWFLSLTSN